ncbi:MAG: hypothetical protein Gaeavirus21_4 [Gaeavirus sp.]|uniref:Uncharacterized protein n=1 Tax=Gaeavirus sp. TaxID=2487767 RepID=A0A3G5A458_9VIRU|nr:MAG: hypothetical protein Gaeavirus21_4 [Gaeavirus sp.]
MTQAVGNMKLGDIADMVGKKKGRGAKKPLFGFDETMLLHKESDDVEPVDVEEEQEDGVFHKNGYTRPEKTLTDGLTKEQIADKIQDYVIVNSDDLDKIPMNTHMRYFSKIQDKYSFRMGGFLHRNNGLPAYIILTNGKTQWSVQVKNTIFYRKMTLDEIKQSYQEIIDTLIAKNKKLKEKLAKK